MSDVIEAIRGALGLVFGGFILLVFAQAFADTTLDTGASEVGFVGVVGILAGALVIVTVAAVIVSRLLT